MALLKYLKKQSCAPSPHCSELEQMLPDPNGLLGDSIPSVAISKANEEVTKVYNAKLSKPTAHYISLIVTGVNDT